MKTKLIIDDVIFNYDTDELSLVNNQEYYEEAKKMQEKNHTVVI